MKTFQSSVKLLLLVFALVSFFSELLAQTVIRGPYLQSPTHNSIIIKWRTDAPTDSKVSFGTEAGNLTQTATDAIQKTEHRIQLTGLSPFTQYYYSVGNTTQTLSGPDNLHRFKTNVIPGTVQPIRVWVIGDFGKANTRQNAVRDSYVNYAANDHTDVWLWLGDNVYDTGTDQEYQDKLFSYSYYGDVLKYMPFWPCPGNHDYGSFSPAFGSIDPASPNHTGAYYDIIDVPTQGEAGGVPSGRELYYSFDYGNVHFISLNSELGSVNSSSHDWTGANPLGNFTGSPMTQWLEADLQANTKPWVIAYWHQPPYSKGSHDSDAFWERFMAAMRENFLPILEQYGVDVILNGHSHVYERSYLLKGHFGASSSFNPATMVVDGSSGTDALGEAYVKDLAQPNGNDGTVYVVCGNSGSYEDGAAMNHPVMYKGFDASNGSFIIDVNGNRLDGKYLSSDGQILDEFTIFKMDTTTNVSVVSAQDVSEFSFAPNPFSKEAVVKYALKEKTDVVIEALDLSGRLVKTIADDKSVQPGSYQIAVKESDFNGKKGIYLLRLRTTKGDSVLKITRVN